MTLTQPSPPQQRLRITFGKIGAMIYVGHLDTARVWERTARRAGLPLAYSHGFNPRPRIQLADALPVGISSTCELIDLWLKTPVALDGLPARVAEAAPPGLAVHALVEVPLKSPALQTLIYAADYTIAFPGEMNADELSARVADFLARSHVEHERRGKTYDLRPLVHHLSAKPDGRLKATLSLGKEGTARPDALLEVLGLAHINAQVHRKRLYLRS